MKLLLCLILPLALAEDPSALETMWKVGDGSVAYEVPGTASPNTGIFSLTFNHGAGAKGDSLWGPGVDQYTP